MTGTPSLDEFIHGSRRGHGGPCAYVRATTPEQRAEIRAKVDANITAWTAFLRWLQAQDVELKATHPIQYHFLRDHAEDE